MVANNKEAPDQSFVYGLSWLHLEKTIIVRVPQEVLANSTPLKFDYGRGDRLSVALGFEKVDLSLSRNFGFEDALIRHEVGDFIEYWGAIPGVDIPTGEDCDNCNGTGFDSFFGWRCYYCRGDKKKFVTDLKKAQALSASLSFLFRYFNECATGMEYRHPQLMKIGLSSYAQYRNDARPHWSLEAMIYGATTRWLEKRAQGGDMFFPLWEVTPGLEGAYYKMRPYDRREPYFGTVFSRRVTSRNLEFDFPRVETKNKTIKIKIDEGSSRRINRFVTAPMYSVVDQLVVLAALAKLHDIIEPHKTS